MARRVSSFLFVLAAVLTASAAGAVEPRHAPALGASGLGWRDLGRVGAARPVTLTVALKYRNPALLERLIALQSTPGSPLYGHFLSNAQFDEAFGPSPAAYAATLSSLRGAGFRVLQTSANRTLIDIAGSAALVERTFGTVLHRVVQAGFGERTLAAGEPRLPLELRANVEAVDGFDDVVWVQPLLRTHSAGGDLLPQLGPITFGGAYGPNATSVGYDLPVRHGFDGRGHGVGNVICGDFREVDLEAFLDYFVIPRRGPATDRIEVDGGAPYFPPSHDPQNCSIESSLDVQTIVGNAPGTSFREYLIPDLSNRHIEDAYNRVVSDNAVSVVNSSFGGCERQGPGFAKITDAIAAQGAAKGITFDASSGDFGSAVCSPKGVSAPASGPHFMAVGGTVLSVNLKTGVYKKETGWSGSGGGVSVIFGEPSYQKLIDGPLPGHRNVPDIALASVNVALLDGGSWFGADGTSWSAPLYAAFQSEIDQMTGVRAGLAAHAFYELAASSEPSDYFHDITTGSNGAYHAKAGYDNVTGIGSVKGEALAHAFP